jgi:hypothetical protein
MALIQSEDRSAKLDRVLKLLTAHCALRQDGIPQSDMAARADLADRMLTAAGDDVEAVDMTAEAFAAELRTLSLNR